MIRSVVRWPNPILKTPCSAIQDGEPIAQLIQDLVDTLESAGGAGLAANQIGESRRVLVIRSRTQGVKVFVNPEIIKATDWEMVPEGCLSAPGVMEEVRRPLKVVVRYLNPDNGQVLEEEFEKSDAHVLAHEVDHLNGIMFIDHLKPGKRDAIRAFLRKTRR